MTNTTGDDAPHDASDNGMDVSPDAGPTPGREADQKKPVWRRILIPLLSVLATIAALAAFWAAYSGRPDEPAKLSDLVGSGAFRGITLNPPRQAPDIDMMAHTGEPFSMDDLQGQAALVFFGYTYCPDICPTTMARVGQGLRALGDDAEQVTVVFVTVDPDRDSVDDLKRYLGNFHPRILGVRGDEESIAKAASDYGVTYSIDVPPEGTPDPKRYTVTHSGYVFLIDPSGQQRSAFLGDFTPDDLAHDVRMVLEEGR